MGTGVFNLNVTIRLAATWYETADPAFNLGPNSQVVFNGPATATLTGQTGDLAFDLKLGKPFVYNPLNGQLLVQIEVWSWSPAGYGAFFFCASPNVAWVYQPLLPGASFVVEGDGLESIVTVKTREQGDDEQ